MFNCYGGVCFSMTRFVRQFGRYSKYNSSRINVISHFTLPDNCMLSSLDAFSYVGVFGNLDSVGIYGKECGDGFGFADEVIFNQSG